MKAGEKWRECHRRVVAVGSNKRRGGDDDKLIEHQVAARPLRILRHVVPEVAGKAGHFDH